jgi:hypothetical protein
MTSLSPGPSDVLSREILGRRNHDDILSQFDRTLAKSPFEAGSGSMPLGPKDPARSLMPAWTRAARSYADGSRLRSRGKEACSPGGVESGEDRESGGSSSSLALLVTPSVKRDAVR